MLGTSDMFLKFCAICGATDDLQHHHFTAVADGGSDDETNMLTLCTKHHREIHSRSYRDSIHHANLTKKGMAAAKARGQVFGNPKLAEINRTRKYRCHKRTRKIAPIVLPMREKGMTLQQIADAITEMGFRTSTGGIYHPTQIKRIVDRPDQF